MGHDWNYIKNGKRDYKKVPKSSPVGRVYLDFHHIKQPVGCFLRALFWVKVEQELIARHGSAFVVSETRDFARAGIHPTTMSQIARVHLPGLEDKLNEAIKASPDYVPGKTKLFAARMYWRMFGGHRPKLEDSKERYSELGKRHYKNQPKVNEYIVPIQNYLLKYGPYATFQIDLSNPKFVPDLSI